MLTLVVLIVILSILSCLLGFIIGRRKGAKEGIEYCFSRYEEAARKNILKDKEDKNAKEKERRNSSNQGT